MRLIIITPEETTLRETEAVNELFYAGLEILHLRKPSLDKISLADYLRDIDPGYRNRITLHDHFSLAEQFNTGGIHLNRRNSNPIPGYRISRSCHTIEELKTYTGSFDYLFLSPVFDSISKSGYKQAFTNEELERAQREKSINSKTIALGGISESNISSIREWGFGGVALLGAMWQTFHKDQHVTNLTERFRLFRKLVENI